MGFKGNTILIRPAVLGGGPEELLRRLGYERYHKIRDVLFETSGRGTMWIGAIGDCIVIETLLACHFFDGLADDPNDSDFVFLKAALFRVFHQAEIIALMLNSVVDGWGYAVFRGGLLVRRSYGYDGTLLGDEGPWLPAESAYFANRDAVEVDGEVRYRDSSDPRDEPHGRAFHGTELTFEVCRSFTGRELDGPVIGRTPGADFWLNDDEDRFLAQTGRRRGWKLWG